MSLSIQVRWQSLFREAEIVKRERRRTQKLLYRVGNYARKTARSLIRRRKNSAKPGKPPTNWTGLLKKEIAFHVLKQKDTVVIGPRKLEKGAGTEVPHVLEFGGVTHVSKPPPNQPRAGFFWQNLSKPLKINPHPYMAPAFDKTLERFSQMAQQTLG